MPKLTIVIGANGAGKSTWCDRNRKERLPTDFYNADSIAKGLGDWNSPRKQQAARELVDQTRWPFPCCCWSARAFSCRAAGTPGAIDFGFRTDDLLVLSVDPLAQGYDPEQARALYREIAHDVGALPGVRSASWARRAPVRPGGSSGAVFTLDGGTAPAPDAARVAVNTVDPGRCSPTATLRGIQRLRDRPTVTAGPFGASGRRHIGTLALLPFLPVVWSFPSRPGRRAV